MFQFGGPIDWGIYFRFDKQWIENMNWALLPKASKAVFPVIAAHTDEHGRAFPGEEIIAVLSGRTPKTVRDGIKNLQDFPGFDWEYYLTRRGKRGKRFNLQFPPKGERGRSFFFHRGIIDKGHWSELSPAAQAVYPAMRYFARYDPNGDESLEDANDFNECFANRRFEICEADYGQISICAGINRHTIPNAIRNLEHNMLVSPLGNTGTFKVYLIPERSWKASHLNQKMLARQGNQDD